MHITALLLSRLQFAFTIAFHIIFPSFTIGLAAFPTILEALHLATGRPTYRVVFEFWLKIFAVAFGSAAGIGLILSVRRRHELAPFCLVAATFAAAFCTFAISFWPYMIPLSITIDAAAAPHASLAFMFWGEGLFVLPLMLAYTAITCRVFHGKVRSYSDSY
jgi:cytochrome bd ubiquinol oxidase subunit II